MTDLTASATVLANVGSSDHNSVLTKLDVPTFRDKPYKRKVWCYNKADYWSMRGYISSTNYGLKYSKRKIQIGHCTKVTDIICTAMEMFIPSKTIVKKPGDKAWFDEKRRNAISSASSNNMALQQTKKSFSKQENLITKPKNKLNLTTASNSGRTSPTIALAV